MSARAGVPGQWTRRLVALSCALLALLNIFLAARRHPLIHIGDLHQRLPMNVVEGSRYALLASGIVLLMTVPGLLHGKRHAWIIATMTLVAALAAHPFKRIDVAGVALNTAVVALLVLTVSAFPARSDPARSRQGIGWLLAGEALVFCYGMAGVYLLDRHFVQQTTLSESFENAVRLLFVLPPATIEPATRHGAWFIDSVRAMALGVAAIAAWHLVHPVIHRAGPGRAERQRVREILDAWADTALAYFHLLDDKSYFFSEDRQAFIGYRVVGHTAVALGAPIGPPASRLDAARQFAQFCDLNGWAFCFHQVAPAGLRELATLGLNAIKVGEDAVVPVQEFALAGKSFKHIRNAVNRLERDGYTVEPLGQPIPDAVMDELEAVSDAWLADGGHRERAFTLGAFSRAYLRSTTVFAVRDPEGRIEAFANVLPSFQSREGNFDLMRRRPGAPDGVMDFLFVRLIAYFRESGLEGMNLGLAPLANIAGGGVTGAALRMLYARGNRAFNFQGLRTFKEKWKPAWEDRYLVYRSDLQLPAIALAVARAGERSGRLPLHLPSIHRSSAPAPGSPPMALEA